jgi:hypothetical protein
MKWFISINYKIINPLAMVHHSFPGKRNSPKMGLNWGIAPILEPCRITKRLKSSNISLDLHQHSAILEHVHKQFFTQTEGGGHLDYE